MVTVNSITLVLTGPVLYIDTFKMLTHWPSFEVMSLCLLACWVEYHWSCFLPPFVITVNVHHLQCFSNICSPSRCPITPTDSQGSEMLLQQLTDQMTAGSPLEEQGSFLLSDCHWLRSLFSISLITRGDIRQVIQWWHRKCLPSCRADRKTLAHVHVHKKAASV